jgi:hypothetical protein
MHEKQVEEVGERPKRFRKPENSKVVLNDDIANNKLRVLLKISDNYKKYCEDNKSRGENEFFKGQR